MGPGLPVARTVVIALSAVALTTACRGRDGDVATAPTTHVTTTTQATTTTTSAPATSAVGTTTSTTRQATSGDAFPVRPSQRASYSHTHAGYPATDIFASCGTTVVAVTSGRIHEVSRVDRWDPAADDPALRGGLAVAVAGDDGVRYYTSHLQEVASAVETGARVGGGEEIGKVGRTGNARNTPCHTHFGISPPRGPADWEVRRGVVWPGPYLDAWRRGEDRSPADAVAAWARAHP